MKPVICFGEALIDFLLIDVTPQEPLQLPEFRQYPGGAPANAAVAIAKLGGDARFAGQVGADPFGDFLADALASYNVNTSFLSKHKHAKTALAFVSLDANGERSFSFHRDGTADVIFTKEQIDPAWFNGQPILHFCSNTLTTESIAECTEHVVKEAQKNSSLISFDVNLRHNLWPEGTANIQRVNNLVRQSDVVKFSREEFEYLSEQDEEKYLLDCLENQCQLLVITDGSGRMDYHTKSFSGSISPPAVRAVDTTAGGDAFVGGLLLLLGCIDQPENVFTSEQPLEEIMHFASSCGACAVMERGAFPALPHIEKVRSLLSENNHDLSFVDSLINRNI